MRLALVMIVVLAACRKPAPAPPVRHDVALANEDARSIPDDRLTNPNDREWLISRNVAAMYARDCFSHRWRLVGPSVPSSPAELRILDLDASGTLNDVDMRRDRDAGSDAVKILLTLRPRDGETITVTGIQARTPCLNGEVVILRNLAPRGAP